MSEVKEVYKAISAATEEISKVGIAKDNAAKTDKGKLLYKFRSIDDVYNSLSPILSKHQLSILPRVLEKERDERKSSYGNALFYTILTIEYDIVCAVDGSKHTVRTYGEAMDSGDKSTNKAMSAAFKYACMQVFCIPTEGDNDADAQAHQVQPKQEQQKPKKKESTQDEKYKLWQEKIASYKDIDSFAFWLNEEKTTNALLKISNSDPELHGKLQAEIKTKRAELQPESEEA